MFRNLKNEAKIIFNMSLDSPLSIQSGSSNDLDPTLPDMQCIRSHRNGEETVFIPGSSIKGVIRSRCERILKYLGANVCNIVDRNSNCWDRGHRLLSAEEVYEEICYGCKMFGSMSLGGRISFKDAYPLGQVKLGLRNGVGIDRITGSAQRGALYDFEVVEDGVFQVVISLTNYELYQLKVLLFAIQDIDDGYVTFGGASTRGNGKMRVEDLKVELRDYRKGINAISGYYDEDKGSALDYKKYMYYYKAEIPQEPKDFKASMADILEILDKVDIEREVERG